MSGDALFKLCAPGWPLSPVKAIWTEDWCCAGHCLMQKYTLTVWVRHIKLWGKMSASDGPRMEASPYNTKRTEANSVYEYSFTSLQSATKQWKITEVHHMKLFVGLVTWLTYSNHSFCSPLEVAAKCLVILLISRKIARMPRMSACTIISTH